MEGGFFDLLGEILVFVGGLISGTIVPFVRKMKQRKNQ